MSVLSTQLELPQAGGPTRSSAAAMAAAGTGVAWDPGSTAITVSNERARDISWQVLAARRSRSAHVLAGLGSAAWQVSPCARGCLSAPRSERDRE